MYAYKYSMSVLQKSRNMYLLCCSTCWDFLFGWWKDACILLWAEDIRTRKQQASETWWFLFCCFFICFLKIFLEIESRDGVSTGKPRSTSALWFRELVLNSWDTIASCHSIYGLILQVEHGDRESSGQGRTASTFSWRGRHNMHWQAFLVSPAGVLGMAVMVLIVKAFQFTIIQQKQRIV